MFLPGAGQFSISGSAPGAPAAPQFTPAATNYGAGPPRKPRPPKKTGMSSYQNVFSVAETSEATSTPSPPNGQISGSGSSNGHQTGTGTPSECSNGSPNGPLPPAGANGRGGQMLGISTSVGSSAPSLQASPAIWGSTKAKSGLPTKHFTAGSDGTTAPSIKEEPRNDFGMQSFSGFASPISAPIDGFTRLKVQSPTSPRGNGFGSMTPNTPVIQYAEASQGHHGINAPPPTPIASFAGKEYRPPPLDELESKDWKRIRTNVSSVLNTPMQQSYYTTSDNYLPMSSLAPASSSYSSYPTYAPTVVPSFPSLGSPNSIMRRVPVEHLLATPIGDMNMSTTYAETPQVFADAYKMDGGPGLEDDDEVEEIQRYDFYQNAYSSPVGMFGQNDTSVLWPKTLTIPRALEPLPPSLLDNHTNKLYFHHFMHETARLLVPHDCEKNPFRKILPQMAVHADHLLNLLLAYSASHRARLLEQPEPTEKISGFLDYTVTALAQSLNSPQESTSDITLATAIMLCSYEIISPNSFETTWQTHLSAARRILMGRQSRGGASAYFLVRWFAYLDVLGSLSGEGVEPLIPQTYWTEDPDADEPHEFSESPVDCVTGTTTRCVEILAKIGELARQCEKMRQDWISSGMGSADQWSPPRGVLYVAEQLRDELETAKSQATACCATNDPNHEHTHVHSPPRAPGSPKSNSPSELLSCNLAFHCAALVHLYRRVFFYPRETVEVQSAASQIVEAFKGISRGGNAENCLLFPLFTAGCEVVDAERRQYVHERMEGLEKIGMVQFGRAKVIMERVWREGGSWSDVVGKEFIG